MKALPLDVLQVILSYHGGLIYRKGEWVNRILKEDPRVIMLENLLQAYKQNHRGLWFGMQLQQFGGYEYLIDLSTLFIKETPYRKFVMIYYNPETNDLVYFYKSHRLYIDSLVDSSFEKYIRA